ncbi:GNAT family N-acetyltransferase [Marinimicrobium sp. ABcell2]|uniref:GNAT family N-acetyltransferase n=1 Tax=Marinimicrobium sp. ABcell2 TaxID=3069751 RepID=UPI0027B7D84C|nr:GNAT family N-acetyltransferase [Marinimicrobium sp. ABcell2]MDQ2075898.1 GNAT family N-acetyltransferase [Marinimicrobium sp. ABcell2]
MKEMCRDDNHDSDADEDDWIHYEGLDMRIRSARIEDSHNISKLIERSALPHREDDFDDAGWFRFVESNSESGIVAKLGEDRRVTLIAEEGDQMQGLISLTGGDKIDLLFVCPHHRRKGVASRLWEAVHVQSEQDTDPVEFWVRSSSAGVPFYERLGFTIENGRQTFSGISFFLMKLRINSQLNGDTISGAG